MKNIGITILFAFLAAGFGLLAFNKFSQPPDPVDQINYLIPDELTSFSEMGNDAELTIYNFFDYSCIYCKETERILSELQTEYEGKFNIEYVPIPIAGENSITYRVTALSICYYQENENMKFHKFAVDNQENLKTTIDLASINFEIASSKTMEKMANCVEGSAYKHKLDINKKIALEMGISSVPVIVIERDVYVGLLKERDYRNLIEEYLND